jgi:hypothetical protein
MSSIKVEVERDAFDYMSANGTVRRESCDPAAVFGGNTFVNCSAPSLDAEPAPARIWAKLAYPNVAVKGTDLAIVELPRNCRVIGAHDVTVARFSSDASRLPGGCLPGDRRLGDDLGDGEVLDRIEITLTADEWFQCGHDNSLLRFWMETILRPHLREGGRIVLELV